MMEAKFLARIGRAFLAMNVAAGLCCALVIATVGQEMGFSSVEASPLQVGVGSTAPEFASYSSPEGWLLNLEGARTALSGELVKGLGSAEETTSLRVFGDNREDGKLELSFVDLDDETISATYRRNPNTSFVTGAGTQIYSNWHLETISDPSAKILVPQQLSSVVMGYGSSKEDIPIDWDGNPSSIVSFDEFESSALVGRLEASYFGSGARAPSGLLFEDGKAAIVTTRTGAKAIEALVGPDGTFTYTLGSDRAIVSLDGDLVPEFRTRLPDFFSASLATAKLGTSGFISQRMPSLRRAFPAKTPNFVRDFVLDGVDPSAALSKLFSRLPFARCDYELREDGGKFIVVVCDYHSTAISAAGEYWFRSMALIELHAQTSLSDPEMIVAQNYRTDMVNFVVNSYDKAKERFLSGDAEDGNEVGSSSFFPVLADELRDVADGN